jgi:ORF6N domain
MKTDVPSDPLSGRIYIFRGQRVVLDADLARLYGVTTKVFNQAIKRNAARFPQDFAFQLKPAELASMWSQIATTCSEDAEKESVAHNWSQFVTSSKAAHRGATYRPWAFTEHGAVMAANVLRSPKAVEMSVYVVRAFIKQRELLATNTTILKRLAEVDKTLLEHNSALLSLWRKLQPLLNPPPVVRKEMGFHTKLRKVERE